VWEKELAAVEHAPEVDVNYPFDVFDAVVVEHCADGDARVVDEDMHLAVRCGNLVGQRLHPRFVGNVCDVRRATAIVSGHQRSGLFEPRFVDVHQRQMTALVCQALRRRASNSTGRSGHHGHSVI
jgi:hypothetical protein